MIDQENKRPQQEYDSSSRGTALRYAGLHYTPADISRRETLNNLWGSLREFDQRMSSFFQRGFASDVLALEFSPEYSDKFVASTISSQVGHDMEVLTRAVGQRTIYKAADYENVMKTLQLADLIAYYVALKPAIDADLIPPTTVVTYFEKSVNIRVIPYAPVALIGFPFRSIPSNPTQTSSAPNQTNAEQKISQLADLLAIPHEIGHYVYWHSPSNGRRSAALLKMMSTQPLWIQNWQEEIYADLYGYVIAGQHAGRQLMRILQSVRRAGLFYDDGEHPVPVLRMRAAIIALTKLDLHETAKKLEEEWLAWLSLQKHETGFHPAGAAEEFVRWDEAKPIVETVVNVIMDELFADLRDKHRLNQTQFTENQSVVLESYDNKFQEIIEFLQGPNGEKFKVPEYRHPTSNGASPQSEMEITRIPGKTETWVDQFLEMDQASDSFSSLRMPVAVWMAILEVSGWVTGPTGPGHFKTYE